MEKEEMDENMIPFAKRSKMVSRCGSEAILSKLPGNISPQRYDDEFWDRLSQQPRFHWMEEYKTSPTMVEKMSF